MVTIATIINTIIITSSLVSPAYTATEDFLVFLLPEMTEWGLCLQDGVSELLRMTPSQPPPLENDIPAFPCPALLILQGPENPWLAVGPQLYDWGLEQEVRRLLQQPTGKAVDWWSSVPEVKSQLTWLQSPLRTADPNLCHTAACAWWIGEWAPPWSQALEGFPGPSRAVRSTSPGLSIMYWLSDFVPAP